MRTALIAAAACVLTACAAESTTTEPNPTTAAETTTATTSPAPAADGPLALGGEFPTTGEGGVVARTTVLSVTQNAAPDAPRPPSGGHWVGADVRFCLDSATQPVAVSWSPWTAVDAEYGTYPPSSLTYPAFPRPLYPVGDGPVAVGDCVRGNVLFPVPDGVTIARIKYAPAAGTAAAWAAS